MNIKSVLISVFIIGPIVFYLRGLLAFAFAIESINTLTNIPYAYIFGVSLGLFAVFFTFLTKNNAIKSAICLGLLAFILEFGLVLFYDLHGGIPRNQTRLIIGSFINVVTFSAMAGYIVAVVNSRLIRKA